jgi:hypothetical protein
MLPRLRIALAALLVVALSAMSLQASGLTDSLKKGTPDLKSAGAVAFGPEGILFIGDSQGGAVFAVATGDTSPMGDGAIKIDQIDAKIAGMLGTTAKEVLLNGVAVNPLTGNAFISVSRGKGTDAIPVIVKIDRTGKIQELPLKDIPFAKATLTNATERRRQEAITQIGYVQGRVIVAGLSNEEFASKLRSIPFPFTGTDQGTSVEIWHTAHAKVETASPVRTFVSYEINGEPNILAAYTCTPLVRFPVSDLKPGVKVRGTTIAELGNRNNPLDMFVYDKDGKKFILLANSSRGVMKITTESIESTPALTNPVPNGGKAGLTYQTIDSLKGVEHMAKLDKAHALLLQRGADGTLNLNTVALP